MTNKKFIVDVYTNDSFRTVKTIGIFRFKFFGIMSAYWILLDYPNGYYEIVSI